jgi:hypothetical protein
MRNAKAESIAGDSLGNDNDRATFVTHPKGESIAFLQRHW